MATGDPFDGLGAPTLGFVMASPIHATVLVQSTGLVEAASPAAIADLGLAPDQIVSRPCETALGLPLPRIAAAAETDGALHRAGGLRFRVHTIQGRNDTSVFLVEILSVSPDHEGELLASRAERLESIVADLAERFDELNRFVGVISHDLQAPLRRLLSFVELLRDDLDDPPDAAASSIEQIESGADHMLRLTTELLRYARLQGAMPLAAVDGDDALAAALTLLDESIDAADATVTIAGSIGAVAATRTFLVLVFQNLVDRALQARAPDRPLAITIDAERRADAVTIEITDDGPGIDANQVDDVFDPFRQLRTGDDIPGAFGMAAVKRIVERFGGEVELAATPPGAGTTFRLSLTPADGHEVESDGSVDV